jgi:hypothetical protein
MMLLRTRVLPALVVGLVLPACSRGQSQQAIEMPGGAGRIVYGPVAGASTPAEAMGVVLRSVHESCRDRPQVGKPFRVRDSDSVAVTFTVVNHPQGEKRVAGLVIASPGRGGPEAALVSDLASRFGTTVNPMLTELFRAWHPGAAPAKEASAPASGPTARLHAVTTADGSASIALADGWTLEQNSGNGSVVVTGPRQQAFAVGLFKSGVDPSHPWQRNFARNGGRPLPGQLVYPYHGNLAQAFPELVQAWRRANGLPPARLQVDKVQPAQVPSGSPPGEECVTVQGHMDPDGKGLRAMSELMCATLPVDWGGYLVTRSVSFFPDDLSKEERATGTAILTSYKVDQEVLGRLTAAMVRQKAADDAAIRAQTRQAVANIRAIGERATIRYNATQAANDAQHAGYWARQDAGARRAQAFDNYLLDQTVIQDNDLHGTGAVGHGTAWNSTADALVHADPDRYEYVDAPGFWKGVDY